MNLSQKEKDVIKHLHEITQVPVKTIEAVFKGLFLQTVLYHYARKKENATISSKLKFLPITIPYIVSFDAEANIKALVNKNLSAMDIYNINYSQELQSTLKNMMDGNHSSIREGLIKELGSEFRSILDLDVPDSKISED